MYKCSKCNTPVIVTEGQTFRVCTCTKENGTPATIVMDMNSTIEAKGGLSVYKPKNKITLGNG
jgi:hypothetical protein